MKYPNIENFYPDTLYFEEIHPCVWLMDDHRWAYFIWEQCLNREGVKIPYSLLHIDYHWDGINDFLAVTNQELLDSITEIDKIYRMVLEGILVRKDSFIAPAIIRGIINEVHFLCFGNDELTPKGLDEELLNRFRSKQIIHNDLCSLASNARNGSLLDIDLDIFNKSDYWGVGDIWPAIEILEFLKDCSEVIKSSPLITIAMSFNYSGSIDDTRWLANLVVPKVVEIFQRK
jgi:hypothetical protein